MYNKSHETRVDLEDVLDIIKMETRLSTLLVDIIDHG